MTPSERSPAWFLTASGEELYEWAANHKAHKWRDSMAALRDAVETAVRAEYEAKIDDLRGATRIYETAVNAQRSRAERAESALAEARREGAFEAVQECRAAYDRWNESGSTNDASLAHDLTALHNKYAPAAPKRVELGNGFVARYVPNTELPWQAGNERQSVHGRTALGMLDRLQAFGYSATPTEYAALLALATTPERPSGHTGGGE